MRVLLILTAVAVFIAAASYVIKTGQIGSPF